MKQLIFLTLLFAFAKACFSQQTVQKQPLMKKNYLQKSTSQKKTASILLFGGAGLIATSFIIPRGELENIDNCLGWGVPGVYCNSKYKNDGIKTAFFIVGGASALGSIPFFIASRKNQRKANAASVFIIGAATGCGQKTIISCAWNKNKVVTVIYGELQNSIMKDSYGLFSKN